MSADCKETKGRLSEAITTCQANADSAEEEMGTKKSEIKSLKTKIKSMKA
jgi:peptidoglycan hydrolase CwlO-like protein